MAEKDSSGQEQQNEFLFMQVIMMFQGAAWQHMGKVMNPVTNKVERDLAQAKNAIDILGMLDSRTKGNLSENEKGLLEHALYELRMNYVDELNKEKAAPEKGSEEEEPASEGEGEKAEGESSASEEDS
ncbi:MAG: DUF1844 domain-containing protein [bacterium]|nr:DUF1844 domain-containing protein [bacterium]